MLDFPQDNDALPLVNDQAEDFVLPVLHTVRGEILRLVYSNPDNQYAVIRLRTDDLQDVTLVGIMPGVMEGQDIEAQGTGKTTRTTAGNSSGDFPRCPAHHGRWHPPLPGLRHPARHRRSLR